jgi:DNA polymerase-3 subunit gamma/tau
MAYEPLHHKYRPQTFGELVGQTAIATTLSNALQQQRIAPAYLFCGPRGTGKTSSARILAKSLNCIRQDHPTPSPCGTCDTCRSITNGSALDFIEIDAASNTGVDNIRELIERAQFAPVQCRYKVYVIDECLTGDSLVLTQDGLTRIDDPSIQGQQVLSYNEQTGAWEFKRALRWLDQGTRDILEIQTIHRKIRCTGNHLIRTDQGWIAARDIKLGNRILSPAPAVAAPSSTESAPIDDLAISSLKTVVSVTPAGAEPVYDIEVEDNHNFVANGLLVHNCHMLSTAAFNALLKTLEEPPSNVVFVLATTDPQRVLPTIISRCQRFDYRRIPLEPMIGHLRAIATQETIDIDDAALRLVAQTSQGGLRDAQSLLDQLSLLAPPITAEAVWDLVGAVPERDLLALVQAIVSDDSTAVLDQARKLMDRGREPLIVLQNLAGFYRDLLIAKTAGDRQDLVAITPPTWADMQTLAQAIDTPVLLQGQQHLRATEVQVKNTTQPRLWLEVALLGLLPSTLASAPVSVSPRPVAPLPTPTVAGPPPGSIPTDIPVGPPQGSAPAPPADPPIGPPQGSAPTPPADIPAEPPQGSAPTPPADPNLDQLWLQVIAVLEPLGTRALMQQQGSLLFFDGTVARIGISSRPLFKMAQGRVENVEVAFQKVLQQKVMVSLEVLPDPKPEAPAPNISGARGQNSTASPPLPPPPEPPAPPSLPPDEASAPASNGLTNPPTSPTSSPPPAIEATPAAGSTPSAPLLPAIASDFDRAVKNFAQFFNGQVVDFDEDLDTLLKEGRASRHNGAASQPSHPDKDVPF